MKNKTFVMVMLCATLGLASCTMTDGNSADTNANTTGTDNTNITLAGNISETTKNRESEDASPGSKIIETNYVVELHRHLGTIQEFTAELSNGRVVQCLTWEDFGNKGAGVSCDWGIDGAYGEGTMAETITTADAP